MPNIQDPQVTEGRAPWDLENAESKGDGYEKNTQAI